MTVKIHTVVFRAMTPCSQAEKEYLPFSTTSISALGLTQPHTEWLPVFFPWTKWTGREVNHSSSSGADVRNKWRYTSTSPICLRGADREILPS
jgi:hypothetical protein